MMVVPMLPTEHSATDGAMLCSVYHLYSSYAPGTNWRGHRGVHWLMRPCRISFSSEVTHALSGTDGLGGDGEGTDKGKSRAQQG